MRKALKNCFYTKISGNFSFYRIRILTQKKSKWLRIKKYLISNKKSYSYVNIYNTKKSIKTWDKFRALYKAKLNTKRFISKLYENSFPLNKQKDFSSFLKEKRVLSVYVAPVFRLDIIMWLLFFTCSPFFSRELIMKGFVVLNGITLKQNVTLSKGDVIQITSNLDLSYLQNRSKYSANEKIFSFIEIDYYTKSFCCLKNWYELDRQDVYLLSTDYVDTQKF